MTRSDDSYEVCGSGPHHVIALHGWFGDRTSYEGVTRWIDRAAFTFALLDQRGYGAARGAAGVFTVEEVAGDALALADGLGWDRFSVVGHSMGGKVAQRLAADAPERVRALVGISPVPASGAGLDADGLAFFTRARDEPAVRRAIIDGSTGERLPASWLEFMVAQSLAVSDDHAFGSYLPSWASDDFHEDVVGSRTPALFVVGRHDPGLSADVMRATVLKWYEASELVTLADAGHYAMDETPLQLVAAIEAFLERHGAA